MILETDADTPAHANGHVSRRRYGRKSESEQKLEKQAEKLAQYRPSQENEQTGSTQAVRAIFVTPLDPVIVTEHGGRLPVIPVEEAKKLNQLKIEVEGNTDPAAAAEDHADPHRVGTKQNEETDAPLREAIPPSQTNPLFPPLPIYGPPSALRLFQCFLFRVISTPLSLAFLMTIVFGAILNAFRKILTIMRCSASPQSFAERRPFHAEEAKRKKDRQTANKTWRRQQQRRRKNERMSNPLGGQDEGVKQHEEEFIPTEGGPDPLVVDIGYYARRVGLDAEYIEVNTEDGFVLELIHLFNPSEYHDPPPSRRKVDRSNLFRTHARKESFTGQQHFSDGDKRYPVLMIHGLLQSAGAFCSNDDDSLAFFLAKSGYDVWLGNNRCGFHPKHTLLTYSDPRMWAWNIRQMGVMDLPAFIDRVLLETGFPKLALIAHSQGTTQTFVALAKEQRPDYGDKISVFCALAPAVYAGPLISKFHFMAMRVISPAMFRMVFGIHAFIPFMALMHQLLPPGLYGWLGYYVFSYLFSWSDKRWDRGLRNRMFQWAPSYVSAESMRWWLGRECFAKQRCILSTRQAGQQEDLEDEEDDEIIRHAYAARGSHASPRARLQRNLTSFHCQRQTHQHHDSTRSKHAWYSKQFPPLALWVCGADNLVDGRRLLRRLDRGREPHVHLVHKNIVEEYEHLDVIWAMDSIDQVGKEVREVIWRTVDDESAAVCRTPAGCAQPLEHDPNAADEVSMPSSDGRRGMASWRQQCEKGEKTMLPSLDETQSVGEGDEGLVGRDCEKSVVECCFVDVREKRNPLE